MLCCDSRIPPLSAECAVKRANVSQVFTPPTPTSDKVETPGSIVKRQLRSRYVRKYKYKFISICVQNAHFLKINVVNPQEAAEAISLGSWSMFLKGRKRSLPLMI